MEQRTEEWFLARLGRVTGSRISAVRSTGNGRETYKRELALERITGKKSAGFTSATMQWGVDNEPLAKKAYERHRNTAVMEVGFVQHPRIAMAGASPDGLVGKDGLLEIKCPSTKEHLRTIEEHKIKPNYILQIQWQLACSGRKWCDFVSYDPRAENGRRYSQIRIERDDELIRDMENSVTNFLAELEDELPKIAAERGLGDVAASMILKNERKMVRLDKVTTSRVARQKSGMHIDVIRRTKRFAAIPKPRNDGMRSTRALSFENVHSKGKLEITGSQKKTGAEQIVTRRIDRPTDAPQLWPSPESIASAGTYNSEIFTAVEPRMKSAEAAFEELRQSKPLSKKAAKKNSELLAICLVVGGMTLAAWLIYQLGWAIFVLPVLAVSVLFFIVFALGVKEEITRPNKNILAVIGCGCCAAISAYGVIFFLVITLGVLEYRTFSTSYFFRFDCNYLHAPAYSYKNYDVEKCIKRSIRELR